MVELEGVEQVALGFRDLGALLEGVGRVGEGAELDAVEFVAQCRPVCPVWLSAVRAGSRASQQSRM
ncbi:hypothetical protein ACFY12_08505 [Streptomyces sp. NPDC001339]|uniref:hypothetical protein n=1 Tax=Streptomyces sp. NPDC001339 TaxID=3364563 RepID=UPI003684980E